MTFRCHRLAITALTLLSTPFLHAASSHTWVSGSGSDSNAGTRTSPYATFATAVVNTTAGGVVSVADPGDFGPVTITKAITIDGGGVGGTITFTGAEGIFINAGSTDTVILRNLTVNGMGTGTDAIFFSSGLNLIIEGCNLENFTSIGLGVGSTSAENIVVRDTTIMGGQLGLRTFQSSGLVPFDKVSMRNVTMSGQSSAAVFSRNGLVEISDSVITLSAIGVEADSGANINIANSVISYNTTDEMAFSPSVILLSNNNTLYANNGVGGGVGTVLSVGHHDKPASLPPDSPHNRH